MKQELTKLLAAAAFIAVIVCLILAVLGTIGAVKIADGCLYRYSFDDKGEPIDVISKTVNLKAHANYTGQSTTGPDGNLIITLDPTKYGSWLDSGVEAISDKEVKYQIRGDLSLCRAYLPKNNLQSSNDVDNKGKRIAIPRLDEIGTDPVSLYFDAKTDEWRNIAELYPNDKVVVSVLPDRKDTKDSSGNVIPSSNVTFFNRFNGQNITADCSDGKKIYNPICGRFTIYKGPYISNCEWKEDCYECNCKKKCYMGWWNGSSCTGIGIGCFFATCWENHCSRCGCWENVYTDGPIPYYSDGSHSFAWSDNINNLFQAASPQCSSGPPDYNEKDKDYIVSGDYLKKLKFWCSADQATGLLYRLDTKEVPTNAKSRGSGYKLSEINTDQSFYNNEKEYKIIYNAQHVGNINYLQYRFYDNDGGFADNTGGYVLNIKQTKCRRTNGAIIGDSIAERGKLEYIITEHTVNPNDPNAKILEKGTMSADPDGNGSFKIPASVRGKIWLRIFNATADYPDSIGEYSVHFSTSNDVGRFGALILTPLLELKTRMKDAGTKIFTNMTCYKSQPTDNCINFFNYVRGMLTIYIAATGLMFLMGVVQISQMNLIIKIIKIIIVAGLLNEKAFVFFNSEIFPFITEFCDEIISNISGYQLFSVGTGTSTNPLMFMDTLMSRILFSKTFLGQILALLSMGISGILYFILIFIAIVITVIVVLRSIAVYLMAFAAIAVLIGIAPLFLTFVLFDSTRYLFDNWVRFTVRYMVEPVILFAGIIVLTQLFTIYLDYAIGYSVCWKCALSIRVPFPTIPVPIIEQMANIELFCLNWFAPWGFDHRSGMMGINIQHIISLIIIAYCLYGYVDLSGKMVVKLVGGFGGPSATHMGMSMADATENKVLGSVGMDRASRQQMILGAKGRMKNNATAVDNHRKNVRREAAARRKAENTQNKQDQNKQEDAGNKDE